MTVTTPTPYKEITAMHKFFITFGQRYKYEAHPFLGFMPMLPDGVLTIEAEDEVAARQWLLTNLDSAYAFIYDYEEWSDHERYYPRGILGDVREVLADVQRESAPAPVTEWFSKEARDKAARLRPGQVTRDADYATVWRVASSDGSRTYRVQFVGEHPSVVGPMFTCTCPHGLNAAGAARCYHAAAVNARLLG